MNYRKLQMQASQERRALASRPPVVYVQRRNGPLAIAQTGVGQVRPVTQAQIALQTQIAYTLATMPKRNPGSAIDARLPRRIGALQTYGKLTPAAANIIATVAAGGGRFAGARAIAPNRNPVYWAGSR